ncbi:unnamed protein product [Eruca vesicaria subsp. sativa]|uniref:Uncharacterized protein n=1 Tax=Eruca vesicaria subsp. sativa TaxID=29727 RepID=A0ABC8J0J9_ERUVS|nr:unnamed protein product [Eruca vesicaria subsp. sativa]
MEVLCLPVNLFRRSKMDLVVPPAIVVAVFAIVVQTRRRSFFKFLDNFGPLGRRKLFKCRPII